MVMDNEKIKINEKIVDDPEVSYNAGYKDAIEGKEERSGYMNDLYYHKGYAAGEYDKRKFLSESLEQKNESINSISIKSEDIPYKNYVTEENTNANLFKEKLFEEGKKAALEGYNINDFINGYLEGMKMKETVQIRTTNGVRTNNLSEDTANYRYHSSDVMGGQGMIALEQFEEYGIDPSLPNARELLENAVRMSDGHSHNIR